MSPPESASVVRTLALSLFTGLFPQQHRSRFPDYLPCKIVKEFALLSAREIPQ
jgi:hypothetical protein